jgi:hypothetical protein
MARTTRTTPSRSAGVGAVGVINASHDLLRFKKFRAFSYPSGATRTGIDRCTVPRCAAGSISDMR